MSEYPSRSVYPPRVVHGTQNKESFDVEAPLGDKDVFEKLFDALEEMSEPDVPLIFS